MLSIETALGKALLLPISGVVLFILGSYPLKLAATKKGLYDTSLFYFPLLFLFGVLERVLFNYKSIDGGDLSFFYSIFSLFPFIFGNYCMLNFGTSLEDIFSLFS